MTDCIFCKIVAGAVPSIPVHEDEHTIAFMDIGHVNPGHTIVAIKQHFETIADLPEDLAAAAFRTARLVAQAIDGALEPDGMTILQANRPAGWQTVGHFHLHVLPRHQDDGVTLGWPAKNPPPEEMRATAEKITAAMGN